MVTKNSNVITISEAFADEVAAIKAGNYDSEKLFFFGYVDGNPLEVFSVQANNVGALAERWDVVSGHDEGGCLLPRLRKKIQNEPYEVGVDSSLKKM